MRTQCRIFVALLVVAVSLAAASTQAKADTVYTGSAGFAAATYGVTTVGIPAPGNGQYVNTSSPYTTGSVSFTYDSSLSILNLNDAAYYATNFGYPANPTNYLILFNNNGAPTDTVTIGFPSSTAFSVELGGTFATGEGVAITLSDGFSASYTLSSFVTSGGGPDFLGFTSATPLTSATLTFADGGADYGTIDQVQYGSVVPEPSSLLLLGTGLIGLGRMVLKKRA